MAWGKSASTTLGSAGDNIDSGTITANKFNQILSHEIASGNTTAQFTFNGSTGNEYANRWSNNGGSENVYGTQSSFDGYLSSSTAFDIFNLIFNSSIVGEEKLSMMFTIDSGGSGAGNAPQRAELVSKYVPSSLSTTITKIECDNTGSGSFDTNSNLTVLGSDYTTSRTPAVPAIPSLLPNLPSGSVGGWVELGRTSNASLPDVTGLADKQYLMFLNFQESNNSRPAPAIRVNGDSGSNYARRGSANGLSDYTNVNQSQIMFGGQPEGDTTTVPYFTVGYIANKSDKEKLAICNNVLSYQLGAGGSDPLERRETVFKWANTSDPIDQLTITNFLSGSFNTNGELIVLGWDPTDTHTTNFWEELADTTFSSSGVSAQTFTAKKYLWLQFWFTSDASGNGQYFQLGDTGGIDTGSTYARRFSINGGSDSTSASQSKIYFAPQTGAVTHFVNMFMVNNASNEKLVIINATTNNGSGAGNAPQRRETVGKWVETTNQCDRITIATDAGTFTGGQLKVWGSD